MSNEKQTIPVLAKPRPDIVQFQREMEDVVKRWNRETNLTISELLGVLEILKFEYMEATFSKDV